MRPNFQSNPEALSQRFKGKKVLYVATTYVEYLRVQQELNLIKDGASELTVIVAKHRSYVVRLIYVYWRLLTTLSRRYDVVFLGFAPQLVLIFWWWKFKRNDLVIDFFISLYDTLVFDRKRFQVNSRMAKWLKKWDRFTLSKADLVVADTQHHAAYFVQDLGADPSKMWVLYLAADRQFYHPQTVTKEAEYADRWVVFYFATVLPLQGVDVVIDAIVGTQDPGIHFVFVGPLNEAQKERLKQQPNLTYHAWRSQTQLATLIGQADLCLAGHFNHEIDKAQRTIPGKAYIFEAMNKTMVLGDNAANRERYPEQYHKVKWVKMGSATALQDTIIAARKEDAHEPN